MNQNDLKKIKETTEDFLAKMTIEALKVEASLSLAKRNLDETGEVGQNREVVGVDIKLQEPQILIGQGGQTLFDLQRLLRTILNKKLQNIFYLDLDINDYKKKKVEYLKDLAKELADQVSLTREEKILSPMSPYERRVIHAELSQRTDISTESQGEGLSRHIVIKPR
jgi:spoIIIJ-associated protein